MDTNKLHDMTGVKKCEVCYLESSESLLDMYAHFSRKAKSNNHLITSAFSSFSSNCNLVMLLIVRSSFLFPLASSGQKSCKQILRTRG